MEEHSHGHPHQPRLFAAVGPFGAGKTTLTINTIRSLVASGKVQKERIAYIINDEGMEVDGNLGLEAEVRPMVNGCFTCTDEADMRRTIDELAESNMEWIFIEGFGITAGSEIKIFLESLTNEFKVFCVVDVLHFEQNLVSYGDLVANQIHSATGGIGLTKFPCDVTSIDDPRLESVVDYVAQHNTGQRVYMIPRGGSIPLEALLQDETRPTHGEHDHHEHVHNERCGHSHHDHAHHEHHHHDQGVHGVVPYYFQLRTNGKDMYKDILTALAGKEHLITRAKGACDGKLFNMVQGTWEQTEDDPRSFLTFYASRPLSLAQDIPVLLSIIVPSDESRYVGESYQLIRRESGTREEVVAAVERLLAEMPHEPIILPAGHYVRLVTHPEHPLQEVKELSRRPSVIHEWFPKVLAQCMRYWIDSVGALRLYEPRIMPRELATNKRELAVSIAWWVDRFPTELDEFRLEAETLNISDMCAEGVLPLTALNSDLERRHWQQRELFLALVFPDPRKDRALVRRAIEHLKFLGAEPGLCADAMHHVPL